MRFGNLENPISIDGTWKTIFDSNELAAAATSITISGLNGDVDEEYELIVRLIGGQASGVARARIQFNADTGANYGEQDISGSSSTAAASRGTGLTIIDQCAADAANKLGFSITKIKAKSGQIRTTITKYVGSISGTTVNNVQLQGGVWNNSVDNLTSILLGEGEANSFGIGSRVILLKKVTETAGMKTGELDILGSVYGTWQEVYSTTLTEAATSLTVSGLTGNTDVLYRVRARVVNGAAADTTYLWRFNNDSGSTSGIQYIRGVNTAVSAARGATTQFSFAGADGGLGSIGQTEVLIYAKSGFVRTAIQTRTDSILTTTVGVVYLQGLSWNNTSDELTSLVLYADQANGWGVGSSLVVERLNL